MQDYKAGKTIKRIQTFLGVAFIVALNGFLIYHAIHDKGMMAILQLLVALAISGFLLWKRYNQSRYRQEKTDKRHQIGGE